MIEETNANYKRGEVDWICCTYKLKDGEKIRVHAG